MLKFERMWDALKDARFVAKIQNFFGVCYVDNSAKSGSMWKKHDYGRETRRCESSNLEFEVKNKFWYFLFLFVTCLGDEFGYSTFITFWFWNVDIVSGRKMVLVWTYIMYIGQAMKDIFCWPRPNAPPVVRLQGKWLQEYGMPSTHAMVGVTIPAALFYFMDISCWEQFEKYCWYTIAIFFCCMICISRLYLGMHTILDVLVGIFLSSAWIIIILPLVDYLDYFFMEFIFGPMMFTMIGITSVMFYPTNFIWTTTRGDTAIIVGACVGIETGSWMNHHFFYNIHTSWKHCRIFRSHDYMVNFFHRTAFGFGGILLTFNICRVIRDFWDSIKPEEFCTCKTRRVNIPGDVSYNYMKYFVAGFNTVCTMPVLFEMMGIGRADYFCKL